MIRCHVHEGVDTFVLFEGTVTSDGNYGACSARFNQVALAEEFLYLLLLCFYYYSGQLQCSIQGPVSLLRPMCCWKTKTQFLIANLYVFN